jgi:hypothetical protein
MEGLNVTWQVYALFAGIIAGMAWAAYGAWRKNQPRR